ncbi:D-methionine transport system substrate-binding protein [Herbaspirillum sp. Sphag1AN]|uniref:MetQ/NlpA family ABC transporter substrate-binding protein n=1 Tax=unclassified Herbaspirillum TaxID=2624150 RepID=UPI00182DB41E|nr:MULTISPECIES: MetQ/NlpA family ABC transporter substrate-binding protein [unclassified Herbaspirillum]MBB3214498.1 D-methionine transport system substrate-binding protein [Herbaspirillum sp. Sphag1AN]MBB3247662.1 D-methionine transport system substrate-binding protein [Herbaspirillum sp. Sphag64]
MSLLLTSLLSSVTLTATAADKVLKVGVTSGPHAEVFEVVKTIFERNNPGYKIKIIEFNDYIQPDAALDAGELDANSYQHRPFLNAQIKARGYKLFGTGKTFIGPIAIYSKKFHQLADLPIAAKIGIPNDPANESRVLLLLQKHGVIKLRAGIDPLTGVNATPIDIVENPRKLRLIEIDAAQLPRTLDDLDASAVNADYAVKAGLNPQRDSLVVEDGASPYACLIAVREKDKDQVWLPRLVQAYQSDEVRKYIQSTFNGAVLAGW